MSKFRQIILAPPGWRVAEVHGESAEEPALEYEPVVAWGLLEIAEGDDVLVPLVHDGEFVDWKYSPKNEAEEPLFFTLLAPGEKIDPTNPRERASLKCWFEIARQRYERKNRRDAA